jgi:hypothetical protein
VGSCYIDMGQRERGQAMLEESIRRAMDENLPHDACRGRLNLGEGLASLDLYEDARTTFEELYDYAGHVYTTLYAASSLIELARLDWLNGHWRTALSRRPLIQEWLERGQSMAYPQVIASTLMGQQYNDLGQPVAAYGVLQSRLSEVRGFDELQLTNFHLAQMGRSLATLGEDKETREVTHELLSSFAHSHYNSRFTAQPVLIVSDILGTHDAADLIDEIVATLKALAQDSANIQVPSRNAALHEAQGSVALFQENHAQAVDLFHQSVTIWKTIQRPYDQARALNKLGRALVLTNACEHAYDAFTQANALLEELAAQLDEDETKAAFLQSLLVQSIQENLLKLRI